MQPVAIRRWTVIGLLIFLGYLCILALGAPTTCGVAPTLISDPQTSPRSLLRAPCADAVSARQHFGLSMLSQPSSDFGTRHDPLIVPRLKFRCALLLGAPGSCRVPRSWRELWSLCADSAPCLYVPASYPPSAATPPLCFALQDLRFTSLLSSSPVVCWIPRSPWILASGLAELVNASALTGTWKQSSVRSVFELLGSVCRCSAHWARGSLVAKKPSVVAVCDPSLGCGGHTLDL